MSENNNTPNENQVPNTAASTENSNSPFANLGSTNENPIAAAFEKNPESANTQAVQPEVNTTASTNTTVVEPTPVAPAAPVVEPAASTTNNAVFQPAPTYYSNSTTNESTASFNSVSETPSKGFAIASLVLSILSIPLNCCCCLGFICAALGIVFGCIQKKDEYGSKPGMAIAGIIISAVSIVIAIVFNIFMFATGSYETTYTY